MLREVSLSKPSEGLGVGELKPSSMANRLPSTISIREKLLNSSQTSFSFEKSMHGIFSLLRRTRGE